MIDVQPYIDKLDKLREYMFMRIDGRMNTFWINIDAIPKYTPKDLIELFNATGMMLYNGSEQPPPPEKLTFENWLEITPKPS